jgi:hypothetical protein
MMNLINQRIIPCEGGFYPRFFYCNVKCGCHHSHFLVIPVPAARRQRAVTSVGRNPTDGPRKRTASWRASVVLLGLM